jgi:hypothetical protein
MLETEKRTNSAFIRTAGTALVVLAVFVGLSSVFLGYNLGPVWYAGLMPAFVVLVFGVRIQARARRMQELRDFAQRWGRQVDRDHDLARSRLLWRYHGEVGDGGVDDQTWADLQGDRLYRALDRTLTEPGGQALYRMLRLPLSNAAEFDARRRILDALEEDAALRGELFLILRTLERRAGMALAHLVHRETAVDTSRAALATVLSVASVAAVAAAAFLGVSGFLFFVMPVFVANTTLHVSTRKRYPDTIPCMAQLSTLIGVARRLGELDTPALSNQTNRLRELGQGLRGVERRTAILRTPSRTSGDIFEAVYQYLRIYLLLDVTTFYWTAKALRTRRDQLQELYALVGSVDALLSAASYRTGMEQRCCPQLVDGTGDLRFEQLVHPLVPDPVPNTIELRSPGAIITGSNMAGKSTFLRAVGLNVLLAQSICAAHAGTLSGGFLSVMSSISSEDDLAAGKSFYYVEAERLLQLTRAAGGARLPVLCIIDELLSGTNTLERVHASVSILEYLAKRNCRTIIATHDLEVAYELTGTYPSYHFSERAGESGLEFDYLLRSGIVSTTNGIRLLTVMGFPKEIVETATQRVERAGRRSPPNQVSPRAGA